MSFLDKPLNEFSDRIQDDVKSILKDASTIREAINSSIDSLTANAEDMLDFILNLKSLIHLLFIEGII